MSKNNHSFCPIHSTDLLRIEYYAKSDGWSLSGFCLKCCKHYALCAANQYMDVCIKLQSHDGQHGGMSYNDSYKIWD